MADLQNLQDQIRKARETNPDPEFAKAAEASDDSMATNMGVRAVTDLIATPIICGAIGMGLDEWFGSKPLAFTLLAFLGVCAGFYNLYRASQGLDSSIGLKRQSKPLQSGKEKGKKAQLSEPE